MKNYITKSAGVLTLLSASIAISHADADVAQLQQQVSQLEQSLKQLKTELGRIQGQNQTTALADTEGVDAELTSEGGDDQSFVTRAELQGLQSDIENYKYQVQRERDTKTALSTRQLLINGVVQAKASYLDEAQVTQPQAQNTGSAVNNRRSSFDLGAVQVGFAGNLFKDYEQGKNLDFNLRFGTSPQTGTNNSYLNLLDAQLIYNVLPTLSADTGRLTVTLGQQLLPFGQEVQATEDLKPTINNALFSLPGYGYGLALREVGLIVRGDALVGFAFDVLISLLQKKFRGWDKAI